MKPHNTWSHPHRNINGQLFVFLLLTSALSVRGQVASADDGLIDKVSEKPDLVYFFAPSSTIDIYADGKQVLPDQWEPEEVGMLLLPDRHSHFLAVHLKPPWQNTEEGNSDIPLGFLLSLEQHIPTDYHSSADKSWKCAHDEEISDTSDKNGAKWFEEDYNDSAWRQAEELGKNGDKPWGVIEAISSKAKWVWTKGSDTHGGVCCRGYLSAYPDTLFVAGKNGVQFDVYNNGRLVGSSKSKGTTHFSLPGAKSHIIAIHAQVVSKKASKQPAFIASLQTPSPPGGVSNKEWRCKTKLSTDEEEGNLWTSRKLDDSKWPHVRRVAEHGDEPWGYVLDVSLHANWIWASSKSSKEVFCRSGPMSSEFYAKGGRRAMVSHLLANQTFIPLPIKPIEPQVKSVKEISMKPGDMTSEKFLWNYLQKGVPFKWKGGIKHWPALHRWTDEYLLEAIGHEKAYVTLAHNGSDVFYFYSEKRRMIESTVANFLQEYHSPSRQDNMYLAQHGIASESGIINPALKGDFEVPRWAKTMKVDAINLWMGQGPQVTPAHFDNVENIMFVVAGRKRFRLYEPSMSNYMYPVSHDKNHGITSRIDNLANPDLNKFPQAVHLRPLLVDVDAGDILFLPAYWWHHVTSVSRNVAVNMWFVSHSSLLDSIFAAWVDRLPQTQWGKLQELKHQSQGREDEQDRIPNSPDEWTEQHNEL